jgi:hypothetical protein
MPAVTGSPLPSRLPRALAAVVAAVLLGATAGCGTTGPADAAPRRTPPPEAVAADGTHTGRTTYQVDRAVRTVALDARSGRVTVTAQDGPVGVAETVTYTDDRPATAHDLTDGTLRLTDGGCRRERPAGGRCDVDWDVHAPADTTLSLTTTTGGIVLAGPLRRLSVRTDAGAVRGRDLLGKEVTVQAGTGPVDLRFLQPPDQLRVVSTSGAISIRVPAGQSYSVDATAPAGPPDVELTPDASATHRIQAHSDAGAVRITNG